jgi:hypothetical protein
VFLVCVFSVEEIGVVGCGCNRLYRIVAGLKFCSCSSFCFCAVRLMSRLVAVFGFAGRLVAVFGFAGRLVAVFFCRFVAVFFLQISCCFLAGRLQISCCFFFADLLLFFLQISCCFLAGRLQISCYFSFLAVFCWQIAD